MLRMKIFAKKLMITLTLLFMSYLFIFIIINLMLGCNTWDRDLWTDANSCILPYELIGLSTS